MKILEDWTLGTGDRGFVVELKITEEPEDSLLRELWGLAPHKGEYGAPHGVVISEGKKVDVSALRASLQRFNEPPEDGSRWSVEALAQFDLRVQWAVFLGPVISATRYDLIDISPSFASMYASADQEIEGNHSSSHPLPRPRFSIDPVGSCAKASFPA